MKGVCAHYLCEMFVLLFDICMEVLGHVSSSFLKILEVIFQEKVGATTSGKSIEFFVTIVPSLLFGKIRLFGGNMTNAINGDSRWDT